MRKETIEQAIDGLDPAYIEEYLAMQEALAVVPKKPMAKWVRLIPIAAAMMGVMVILAAMWPSMRRDEEPRPPLISGDTAETMASTSSGTPHPVESAAEEKPEVSAPEDIEGTAPDLYPEESAPGDIGETEDKPIASPEILYDVFSLFSINDLKTYFSNGFADLSLYETPPVVSSLVSGKEYPSASFNGYFVDLYELFPALNPEKIVLKDIGFDLYPGRHSYEYDCHTLDGKGGFRVRVEYRRNAGGMADMTEEEITATYSRFIENGNEIVFEDYAKTQYKPHTWKGIIYIGIGDGYTTVYEVWKGKVEGMSIYAGDLVISVFAGIANEYDYLTHEDLRPIACLRTDSPERDEALRRIAAYCQALQKEHA